MSIKYNDANQLLIGEVPVEALAQEYGTSLIAYDEQDIIDRANAFHKGFQKGLGLQNNSSDHYSISYASKAFSSIQMIKLVDQLALDLDVVSLGEMYVAKTAGFPAERVHFHGNNKTREEIQFALDWGIGHFVVDSFDEIEKLMELATEPIDVMIRVNPESAPDTHQYIQTSQEDSKFGFSIQKGLAKQAIAKIQAAENLKFIGVHFHVGSQIKNSELLLETAKRVLSWAKSAGIPIEFLNVGGGFSIQYVEGDQPFDIEPGIETLASEIAAFATAEGLTVPKIGIEPGRSMIGSTAITIYEVGTIKEIPEVSTYVSIDGGMSDHIRTALYGAEYTILPTVKPTDEIEWKPVNVVGKLCESGDVIGRNKLLPASIKVGDYVAVCSTGAYHYAMASNYNNMLKPAVVFVKGKEHRLVIKRQSLNQLIQNDILD